MVYLLFSKQALSSTFLYSHFCSSCSFCLDWFPASIPNSTYFSLPHPSRPNMQTTSSMKLPSISWVHLSLLWTNRKTWCSPENSTMFASLTYWIAVMCQVHFPKCWVHPDEQYIIFAHRRFLRPKGRQTRKPAIRIYVRNAVIELCTIYSECSEEGLLEGWGTSAEPWKKRN